MPKTLSDLRAEWMLDPETRAEYDALAPEFAVASAIIAARKTANLSQAQLAERMGTTQSVIARLESGRTLPSIKTLLRVAKATGTKPEIRLVAA
ncbi:MAG: helix-turn-helix transcriptional regulator [Alphaproteobacteria bacterium]|nr:helix-turn-helix transcriptional regulator [Alphaproteobacteria bacterium]